MNNINKIMSIVLILLNIFFSISICSSNSIKAKDIKTTLEPSVYVLDENSKYEWGSEDKTNEKIKKGHLILNGQFENNGKEYLISGGNINISYEIPIDLLNNSSHKWHIVSDKSKKLNDISLNDKMNKGAIIVQVSKDNKNWITEKVYTNIFEDSSFANKKIYTTTEIQQLNGCYYRVIVGYKVERELDKKKILFLEFDNFQTEKRVEIFEFYLCDKQIKDLEKNSNEMQYVESVTNRTEEYDGYFGISTMEKNDPHYSWRLGEFVVSGFTGKEKSEDGTVVFLKNTGDNVTLSFKLKQDINCLNNNKAIKIVEDTNGYDKYFQTNPMNFGKGTLIVRKVNSDNSVSDPTIYTNFLEANAKLDADTVIDLFEEGDYEVALDYAIQYDKTKIFGASVLPKLSHYRMYLKFSIRDGNTMVYPFDISTNSELSNRSLAPNGFYVSVANSKYLLATIQREVLNENENGITLDTRFNKVLKDGNKYIEEGIYTITVKNEYVGTTIKQIYVGDNNILKAHVITGLTIDEINDKLKQGATITNEGKLIDTSGDVYVEDEIIINNDNIEVVKTNDLTVWIILGTIIILNIGGIIVYKVIKKRI